MRAGKATEGYELLSEIQVGDLRWIDNPEQRGGAVCARVQRILERERLCDALEDNSLVVDLLVRAARRGDHEARDLLMFGDLEDLGTAA
jgi:hypothetical protein